MIVTVIRIIRNYLKKTALLLAILAPLVMFAEVFMDLMQPKLLEKIIDIGIANHDLHYVYVTGWKMILAAFIGLLGGASCSVLASISSADMAAKLRQGLFDKIQTLSFLEIDRFSTASLITRLTNDVTQVQNMLNMLLRGAVRSPLLCIGGIIMAATSSPPLSVIFVIALPLLLGAAILILKKSFPIFLVVQERIDYMNTVMRESILGVRVIKALTMEEKQWGKFEEANESLKDSSMTAQNMNMLLWPIVTLIMNLSIVGILWFGGNMVNRGTLEVGKIMAFINYLIQIMNSLIMLVSLVLNFSRAHASTGRINEVLDTEPSIQDKDDASGMNGYDIVFDHVSFCYNENSENVIKNVSLEMKEGEKIGIIGSTGSGKSTFVHLISRLYDVTKGEIRIGGIDIRNLKQKDLKNNIGYVLQETILFSGTIENVLKFGNDGAGLETLEQAAKDAQAYDFIMEKENKYQSVVEQRAKNFSGGQKQRLSIARTLVKQPKILILDDSTSALDVATESKLQTAVSERMKKSTVITIAQRVSAIMNSDKIIVMDNGEVTAFGSHKELLKKSEIYRNIAVSQLGEEVLISG